MRTLVGTCLCVDHATRSPPWCLTLGYLVSSLGTVPLMMNAANLLALTMTASQFAPVGASRNAISSAMCRAVFSSKSLLLDWYC